MKISIGCMIVSKVTDLMGVGVERERGREHDPKVSTRILFLSPSSRISARIYFLPLFLLGLSGDPVLVTI